MKTKKVSSLIEGVYVGNLYALELWKTSSQYSEGPVHVLRAVYYLKTDNGERNVNEILNVPVVRDENGELCVGLGERSLLYKRLNAWMKKTVDINDLNFSITAQQLDECPDLKNFRDREADAIDVTIEYHGRIVPQAACQVVINMNKNNYPRVADVVPVP